MKNPEPNGRSFHQAHSVQDRAHGVLPDSEMEIASGVILRGKIAGAVEGKPGLRGGRQIGGRRRSARECSWPLRSAPSPRTRVSPGLSGPRGIRADRGPSLREAGGAACETALRQARDIACDTRRFAQTRHRADPCLAYQFPGGSDRRRRPARRISCLRASRSSVWRDEPHLLPTARRARRWYPACAARRSRYGCRR